MCVCLNRTSLVPRARCLQLCFGRRSEKHLQHYLVFFSLTAKASRSPSSRAGPYRPISRASLRFYSTAGRAGRRAGPGRPENGPHSSVPTDSRQKKKAQRYLALRFLCSLCLAPPIEDTKKWAWRETRHRAPSRFSSPLGSRSPRDGGGGGKKKKNPPRGDFMRAGFLFL